MSEDPIEILTFGPLLAKEPRATFALVPEQIEALEAKAAVYAKAAKARSEATRARYLASAAAVEGGE